MYSLDCDYFVEEFDTIEKLIYYVEQVGMDPNYEITRNGKGTGEMMIDLIQFGVMMFIVLTLLVLFIINVNDENGLVLMCLNKENGHGMIIDIEMKIDGITQEGKLTWVDGNKNDGLRKLIGNGYKMKIDNSMWKMEIDKGGTKEIDV